MKASNVSYLSLPFCLLIFLGSKCGLSSLGSWIRYTLMFQTLVSYLTSYFKTYSFVPFSLLHKTSRDTYSLDSLLKMKNIGQETLVTAARTKILV